jgi:hypothetical protein
MYFHVIWTFRSQHGLVRSELFLKGVDAYSDMGVKVRSESGQLSNLFKNDVFASPNELRYAENDENVLVEQVHV